ncbi:MAG: sensor histidine kinase KdpD [Liquorilactobacillus ghanensis]|uniref:ATP-binding protein n=1 Tax=Liquorilactobacillus ghanensis TaxID=399370 RepID=UPI0039EBC231
MKSKAQVEHYLKLADADNDSGNKRGKLKIFFGYAAGVGKTYRMLMEAQDLRQEGYDVVVGYIERHGRSATENLIENLEVIPVKTEQHHNILLKEFDLDAALKRQPQIILVDELAHTNSPASRHEKRYQDIQELLNAGIDVYTTLNVQHLESLQNILADHLHLNVQERVPDYVFDLANQLQLIDIEPEELITRLKKGKIYAKQQIKQALTNFFTTNNLVALRELALRKMSLRLQTGSKQVVERFLVCVSGSYSSAHVIRSAAQLAEAFSCELIAVYVKEDNPDYPKNYLDFNLNLAHELGAKIVKLLGEKPAVQIAEYAKVSQVTKIILGSSPKTWLRRRENDLVTQLGLLLPEVDKYIINEPVTDSSLNQQKIKQRFAKLKLKSFNQNVIKSWIIIFAVLIVNALISEILFHLDKQLINIVLIYILGVMVCAILVEGQKYGIFAAIAAVLCFNFFFTQPYFSLEAGSQYLITFGLMLFVAIISNSWTLKIKKQAVSNAQRVYRTEALLTTIQQLQSTKKVAEVIAIAAKQLQKIYPVPIIFYKQEHGKLTEPYLFALGSKETIAAEYFSNTEQAVAFWTLKNGQEAGAKTTTLPNSKCWYLPVFGSTPNKVMAVVAFVIPNKRQVEFFDRNLIISILDVCGQAFERMQILKAKRQAEIKAQQEKLRTDLLRGISHDLRTPLTNISGSIDVLRRQIDLISREEQLTLYDTIYKDAAWLINLVENLLAMTHLESQLQIKQSPELVDEIITEALEHLSPGADQHTIQVKLPDELLMVQVDAKLVVQVVINIVNNAVKYTPNGSHIWITAFRKNQNQVQFEISNDGPQLSVPELTNLFKLFYTGERQADLQSQRGLGIGLSLCKSVIESFGGTIWAKNLEKKGICFYFTLPAWGDKYEKK